MPTEYDGPSDIGGDHETMPPAARRSSRGLVILAVLVVLVFGALLLLR